MQMEDRPPDESERYAIAQMQHALDDYIEYSGNQLDVPGWLLPLLGKGYRQYYRLRSFLQRGKRGYSENDCVDATQHILLVISGMVRELRLYGEPSFPEELELEDEPDEGMYSWYSILETIERSTYRYGKCLEYSENLSTEELDWAQAECDHALQLFAVWYTYLHD